MQLDIIEFYPSITEELFSSAIAYARTIIDIDQKTIDIIMHSRQSLLFTKNDTWVKKNNSTFDVTMGSYDGAEICELIGIYLLHLVNDKFPEISFGLYRDDGLGSYSKMPGPRTEKIRKDVIKLFKDNGFSITINMDMTTVNFLDVIMNISTHQYKPYHKPNDTPLYINKKSNHPPSIIKQIPNMVQTRLSSLSCNEVEFNKVKEEYSNALLHSGFKDEIMFQEPTKNIKKKRKRQRNILWFNPPYNESVNNSIEKEFYLILDKHFPKHHKYNKIFNRHNVRLSYSCTPNMNSIISSHNKKLLNMSTNDEPENLCNCGNSPCPLDNQCMTPALIYNGHLSTEESIEHYTGSTEPP